MDQIKKTLGNDFGSCWESVSLVLKTDEKGLFFIEWLDNSEKKAKSHSKHQSDKRKGKTKHKPNDNQTEPEGTKQQPLGDGYVDGNDIGLNNKKESDFSKPDIGGDELVFPIDTTAVRALWSKWKRYRWEVHQSQYGMMGEQADLKRLERMDFGQIEQTILSAIANNWKNLYPEKNGTRTNNNGKGNSVKADQSRATSDYLADYYSNKAKQQ